MMVGSPLCTCRIKSAPLLLLIIAVMLSSCGKAKLYMIELMPAPDVYTEASIDPFADVSLISEEPTFNTLYVTDRAPSPGKGKDKFYLSDRGDFLRVGMANIKMSKNEGITWEEARRISLLKNRTDKYPLQIDSVSEFGILAETVPEFDDPSFKDEEPGRQLIETVNQLLERSRTRDIYIYVHGYKVTFENPVLVAAELWHFLGYNGAFIAYSWPATPKMLAYFSDLEDATNSARNLRKLIVFLAKNTDADKIHILGYSAGTRVVARALADLGIYSLAVDEEELNEQIRQKIKIGRVILVGSDIDRDIFGGYLQDGILRIPDSLTAYISQGDSALGMSKGMFGKKRVGQIFEGDFMKPEVIDYLQDNPNLAIVDVTKAEASLTGSGHSYFRQSPWVSSDLLMTLMYGLEPGMRGLVLKEDTPIWEFPPDYIERLKQSLFEVNPALAEGRPEVPEKN